MGSFRRRLALAGLMLWAAPAQADVCGVLRPNWDGQPLNAFDELVVLFQTPLVLILVLASALAVRFRSEWAGLAVVVGWSIASYLALGVNDTDHGQAQIDGCIGNPSLFIAVAGVIGIGVVLYTAPLRKRDN